MSQMTPQYVDILEVSLMIHYCWGFVEPLKPIDSKFRNSGQTEGTPLM